MYYGFCDFSMGGAYVPDVRITAHARQRFAERTDIPDSAISEFVREALRFGRDMYSYRGQYMQFLCEKASSGLYPITYKGLLLLVAPKDNALVTLYPLPDWFLLELPSANIKETFFTRAADRVGGSVRQLCSLWRQLLTGCPDSP